MIPAQEALARLREGNRRFVASGPASGGRPGAAQQPFAIVLGCSDSRVPAELVFGQGFGDLFVIRVAGNIVAPSQVGSVEFAANDGLLIVGAEYCVEAGTVEFFEDDMDEIDRCLRK